ncbi:MAG: serine/threonine-protein kinase [Polyangiaceae bacterium]
MSNTSPGGPPSMKSTTSEQLVGGKYHLIAELGQGGMANVYLAMVAGQGSFRKLAVVKKLRGDLSQDVEFLQMFLEEARLAARLAHPNVVHTYDVGQDDNGYFIAMEYLDGVALQNIISRAGYSGVFTITHFLRVLIDVLAGLNYAHEVADLDGTPLRLVHRDVSPQNVLVTFDGQVKLVDFGIAKAANSAVETRTGVIKGKVTYMAPEQAISHDVDASADTYAIGVMLWEVIAQKRRWKGMPAAAVFQKLIQKEAPEPPGAEEHGLPARLDEICVKAMQPDPEKRYRSAHEMQSDLETVLFSMPNRATSRDVGLVLCDLFAAERVKRKTLIDAQLKALENAGSAVPLVVAESFVPQSQTSMNFATMPQVSLSETSVTNASASLSTNSLQGKRTPHKLTFAIGGVLVAASVAVGVVYSRGGERTSGGGGGTQGTVVPTGVPTMPTSFPMLATSTATAATPEKTSSLTMLGLPDLSAVTVDGRTVNVTGGKVSVPADGQEHTVVAQATGYEAQSKKVRFDQDQVVAWSMKRMAGVPLAPTPKATASTAQSAVVAPPPVPTVVAPPPPANTRGALDPNDPFAKKP